MKVAIIGAGAAGLSCAWLLDRFHDVSVFEKQPIPGGNVRTLGKNVSAPNLPPDVYVDNGVIEFQKNCFHNVQKLMAVLDVELAPVKGGIYWVVHGNRESCSGSCHASSKQVWFTKRNIGVGQTCTSRLAIHHPVKSIK